MTDETNWEHYFGSEERASLMEVHCTYWPATISVWQVRPRSRYGLTTTTQHIKTFKGEQMTPVGEVRAMYDQWLRSRWDDGTIIWDD